MTKKQAHQNITGFLSRIGVIIFTFFSYNVSRACKIMGVSRDTFYRYQELAREGGIQVLVSKPININVMPCPVHWLAGQPDTHEKWRYPSR